MRIATWNVNSIRTRVGRVVDWLVREDIDVLAMQEIKCKPDQFPLEAFERAGYEVAIHGLNQWNGVAIASRHGLADIEREFPSMPGFGKPVKGMEDVQGTGPNGLPLEARALGATVGDLRLWSLYVPNGRALDNPHYAYKLEWLRALKGATEQWLEDEPGLALALMGDWNIAPHEGDMADPSFTVGLTTHVSPAERAMMQSFEPLISDVVRPFAPEGFTFWDYQAGKFQKNEGMRIDFILGSEAFASAVTGGSIHRHERTGDAPSDHVPVVCELDPTLIGTEDDEDLDRPMIF